ncbi:hypothetical protein H4R18_001232 [Coemansia javaensis]|uniref:Uncharacterized protein n=1 Tax=Coemansia javaensis TaxID=2761396 RepID=A0A9W8HKC2_9FUNG|nr:hypothetical protein H4R18_001232 [Coemansia javaensis]
MEGELTADQAAQRLLALVDGVEAGGGGRRRPQLAASSISWGFHDSADTTGLLRWVAENLGAGRNGLAAGELELVEHLDRAGYRAEAEAEAAAAAGAGRSELELEPEAELAAQAAELAGRVGRLAGHVDTVRAQGAVLAGRADQMARAAAELRDEEERLGRALRAADGEAARLAGAYRGALDEAALAARALESRLGPGGGRRSLYQCGDAAGELGAAAQAGLGAAGARLAELLGAADRLPPPWRGFGAAGAQGAAALAALAADEHGRIARAAPRAAAAALELDVAGALVRAIAAEADRARAQGCAALLQRCHAAPPGAAAAARPFAAQLRAAVGGHAARLAAAAQADAGPAPTPAAAARALAHLDASAAALARALAARTDRVLGAALEALEPRARAVAALAQALAAERDVLGQWARMWAAAADSLDRSNAALERQRVRAPRPHRCHGGRPGEIQRHGAHCRFAPGAAAQVIAPDDRLALALKRLLAVPHGGNGSGGSGGSGDLAARLAEGAFAEGAFAEGAFTEGAFTEWAALLADARAHRRLLDDARRAVSAEAKAVAAASRQLDCSIADLAAALHGGDAYSGTEAPDVLPTSVRDALGELKHQASVMRQRVTKAAMLAEEPRRAVESEYAALFCQFY